MRSIEQALQEVRSLHEQVTRHPAPEISPQAFLPFPPGLDPVAYAIEEVNRLKQMVEQAGGRPETKAAEMPTWVPRADVYAGESSLCFVLEIPGVAKDDVEVLVIGPELVVRGQRRPASSSEERPLMMERPFGAFERRFPLPAWSNTDTIAANYHEGILEIQLRRSEGEGGGELRIKID